MFFLQVLKFCFFIGFIFCDCSTEFCSCKIHKFFHRVFLCHMLFYRFFTGSHPIVLYVSKLEPFNETSHVHGDN